MFHFLFTRGLRAVFTLLGVLALLFVLQQHSQGVELREYWVEDLRYSTEATQSAKWSQFRALRGRRGLDRPLFYFGVVPRSWDEEVLRIADPRSREWYRRWTLGGYALADLQRLQADVSSLGASCPVDKLDVSSRWRLSPDLLHEAMEACGKGSVTELSLVSGHWLPTWRWHGGDCRLHHLLKNLSRPIRSEQDGRPAMAKMGQALMWTLSLGVLSLILSYGASISLGFLLGWGGLPWISRVIRSLLRGIYSLPLFLMATLGVVFLTTSYYGAFWNWFPVAGLFDLERGRSTMGQIFDNWDRLVLPILLMSIHALPVLSTLFGTSVERELDQPYVVASRSRGLSERSVLFFQVGKNAVFPMITSLGGSIIALVSGSLVIEVVFGIPGMGKMLYDAVLTGDWPLIYVSTMCVALLVVASYVMVDLLYRILNPKLSWR